MRPTTRSCCRESWSRRLLATTSPSPRSRSSTGAAPAGRSRAASSTSAARSSKALERGRTVTGPATHKRGPRELPAKPPSSWGITIPKVLDRFKPYWLHAYILTYLPLLLLADSHITALWQQWMLGVVTFGAPYLVTLKLPKEQRLQVWICVVVA